MQENRRHFERVHLTEPLAAKAGGKRAFILDVSLSGFRAAHQHPMPIGSGCAVEIDWEGERAVIDCRVVRTHAHRSSSAAQPVYHSGLEMLSPAPALIRRMVEWHVLRALDERKANARGIPPVAAQSFQTGAGRNYIRHEMIAGTWRALSTTDPAQPRHGFTVSASTSAEEMAMLRETYAGGDRTAREMLQRMAELSISAAEGIPTRKYVP